MKILMEHIPRTIFAVKYNHRIDENTLVMNEYKICRTKNAQDKLINKLREDENYSEVKPIKWSLRA